MVIRCDDCNGKDTLVKALGRCDSQHVVPTQGSLGDYSYIKQGIKES